MERYRSGRNGGASKASCPKGHVGSNPTLSAKSRSFLFNKLVGYVGSQRAIRLFFALNSRSRLQISPRDSLMGMSRCVGVSAMSIVAVRGLNMNCDDLNLVTWNGSPTGLPVEGSNGRPHTLGSPVRFETK